jgi:hypothetical protein
MTKKYDDKRQKAMENRERYDEETLKKIDMDDKPAMGGGDTDPDNWTVDQFPYPVDQSIKRREKVNLKVVDPRIGGD